MGYQSKLSKLFIFPLLERNLIQLYGKDFAMIIVACAEQQYADCVESCKGDPEGESVHLHNTVLPLVAIYKSLLELDRENALPSIQCTALNTCSTVSSFLRFVLRIPGMRSVFLRHLSSAAEKHYANTGGFACKNLQASKKGVQIDITACLCCKYTKLLGCPELTSVFCDSGQVIFANLPGIAFERTGTLECGGACCDFRFSYL